MPTLFCSPSSIVPSYFPAWETLYHTHPLLFSPANLGPSTKNELLFLLSIPFFLGVLLQAKESCYISHNFSQKCFTLTSLGHHNTKNSFNKKDTDNFVFTRLTKSIWEHITIFYKSWLNGIDWGFVIIFAYNFTSICTQLKLCKYNS